MGEPKPKPRAIEFLHIAKSFLALANASPIAVMEIADIMRRCGATEAADMLRELVCREHPDMGR